jgi:hypothetical protein
MGGQTMKVPGQYNSSITRVRPFFQLLLRPDPTEKEWLSKLLSLSKLVPPSLCGNPGVLLPCLSEVRPYHDKVLKKPPYNILSLPLERCFEHRLPPPKAFLNWLIENAAPDVWATRRNSKMREETRFCRDRLFGLKGPAARQEAILEARTLLNQHGGKGSDKKWWAFEGFTEVDCYLETEHLILLIEGKRTEPLSGSTDWYTKRNQLMRNLEAVAEMAGDRQFGVMVLSETPMQPPSDSEAADSFPHFQPESQRRDDLMKHFWGCFTWAEACERVGLKAKDLPETTEDWIKTR